MKSQLVRRQADEEGKEMRDSKQPKIDEWHSVSTVEARVQAKEDVEKRSAFRTTKSQVNPIENVLIFKDEPQILPQLPLRDGKRCLLPLEVLTVPFHRS